MTLLENVEQVLNAVADLKELRNQLAALDEERAILEDRIRQRLAQIADSAEGSGPGIARAHQEPMRLDSSPRPARTPGMTERVLVAVNAAGGEVGAGDIAASFGRTDESTVNSIRAALSRLTADEKIRKVGYGRYTAIASGATGGATAA